MCLRGNAHLLSLFCKDQGDVFGWDIVGFTGRAIVVCVALTIEHENRLYEIRVTVPGIGNLFITVKKQTFLNKRERDRESKHSDCMIDIE